MATQKRCRGPLRSRHASNEANTLLGTEAQWLIAPLELIGVGAGRNVQRALRAEAKGAETAT